MLSSGRSLNSATERQGWFFKTLVKYRTVEITIFMQGLMQEFK